MTPKLSLQHWFSSGGPRRLAIAYFLSLVVWFCLGIAFALQQYRNAAAAGANVDFLTVARIPVIFYLVFGVLTPGVFLLTHWCNFDRRQWWKGALIHAAGVVVFGLSHALIRLAVFPARRPTDGSLVPFTVASIIEMAQTFAFDYLWMYATIAGIAYAVNYYGRLREREVAQAKMQTRIATFELQALRMQIQPHFLFNTLHAISALMAKDVPAARTMIVRLSDLLRVSIEDVFVTEVALSKELRFLESYLGIEQMRFGSRLQVEWHIDQETLAARTPNLLLQPLVENAIKHGIGKQFGPGKIEIESSRVNGTLRLRVSNDGPTTIQDQTIPQSGGIGLANTRSRLLHLYGSRQSLNFQQLATGGAEVIVEIPFQTETEEDESK